MTQCVDPSELEEGALIAFVDGRRTPLDRASARVQAHLDRCPHCRAQVAVLHCTLAQLRAQLYRTSCPAPEELGLYQLNLLPPDEQLVIARHVRECPHCRRELDQLAGTEERPSLLERVRSAVRAHSEHLIEAQLIPVTGQAAAAFRGPAARSQRFRADDVELHVSVYPGHNRGRRTVMGRISLHDGTVSPPLGTEIWLMQGDEAWAAAVEAEGVFTFEDVVLGAYALSLEWEGQVVVVKEVVVS